MGGLSGRAKQRAAALADEADLRLSGAKGFWSWAEPVQPTGAPRCPEPGVWLRRHYRGREVRVQVRAKAYKEYLGRRQCLATSKPEPRWAVEHVGSPGPILWRFHKCEAPPILAQDTTRKSAARGWQRGPARRRTPEESNLSSSPHSSGFLKKTPGVLPVHMTGTYFPSVVWDLINCEKVTYALCGTANGQQHYAHADFLRVVASVKPLRLRYLV